MSLKIQIQDDMKSAMRAKEAEKLSTIRMLLAAIKQKEIDEQIQLEDTHILSIVNKMIKQRRDAADQFKSAGRDELAEKEQREMLVLEAYLPQQLSDAEISQAIQQAVEQTQAESIRDMGKVMGVLQSSLQGRADMAKVSQLVKQQLA